MATNTWLSRYSTTRHAWTSSTAPSTTQTSFHRPLGLVETSFDTDGTYYGGRADMTATFKLCISHQLSTSDLRKRIILAWTLLRLHHVLLMSRVEDDPETGIRGFVIDVPKTAEHAIQDVEKSMIWLDDLGYDAGIDEVQLHHHALNVSRIIQPRECMSKIHVLPLKPLGNGTFELRFLVIMAHQISDGLSAYNWFSHFISILNSPLSTIQNDIQNAIDPASIKQRLPSAQEDLYPRVTGSRAKQRWFWAIIRVLRHAQRSMSPTFTNPLRREKRLEKAITLGPVFENIFDYAEETKPPMSSGTITATLSPAASKKMMGLCRDAGLSIGAGCFALAGMSMMKVYEERYLSNPNSNSNSGISNTSTSTNHPAFGASFPLNPRAFFTPAPPAESCMLAFSEGILMPFLPSSLPMEQRFKFIAKRANRELRVYQKRAKKDQKESTMGLLDKHSPNRLLATGYIAQIERVDAKIPLARRSGFTPQGSLAPKVGQYGATCGVSSVGSMAAFFKPGTYDVYNPREKDFVADYRGLKIGVRARDNEFLIGSSSDHEGRVSFGVSYDLSAISQEAAENWAETVRGLLEPQNSAKL